MVNYVFGHFFSSHIGMYTVGGKLTL